MNPTQIEHPWQAVVRTVFAAFVALCAMAPLLIATDVPEGGVFALGLSVAGTVTRIMAIPAVNDWLDLYLPWLSAEGK